MRILYLIIPVVAILSLGCKKSTPSTTESSQNSPAPSPSASYRKIKETRSVDTYTSMNFGPRMSQAKYIYNTAGQLSEVHFIDSTYSNNSWSVSTSSYSVLYNSNGKISILTDGINSINYVYDSNNKLKYEISGTDTTKYISAGNQVISTRISASNATITSYYTQNLDSIITNNQSNTAPGRIIYTRNTTLDLRWAYLNQFDPIVEDYNEIIKSYSYPTGSYPAVKNYTITYDANNYPIKQASAIDYETYSYY